MKLIVCLDDRNGMLFHNRRQSRDELVCKQILALSKETTLWMNAYSAKLFGKDAVRIAEDFLDQAQHGDYCFVENVDVRPYKDKLEKIYVFRWNRLYPVDTGFPEALLKGKKTFLSEFPGSSHSCITLEVYEI